MCKKIFIAATGQNTGKTTISLSLLHLARQKYKRVGFIKAVGPKCQEFNGCIVDKDAALIARVFGMEEDIRLMSPVVLACGVRVVVSPHYEILVPLILLVGAAGAVLTQVRVIQARAAAEA